MSVIARSGICSGIRRCFRRLGISVLSIRFAMGINSHRSERKFHSIMSSRYVVVVE